MQLLTLQANDITKVLTIEICLINILSLQDLWQSTRCSVLMNSQSSMEQLMLFRVVINLKHFLLTVM